MRESFLLFLQLHKRTMFFDDIVGAFSLTSDDLHWNPPCTITSHGFSSQVCSIWHLFEIKILTDDLRSINHIFQPYKLSFFSAWPRPLTLNSEIRGCARLLGEPFGFGVSGIFWSGVDGVRTPDLEHQKRTLYPLRYAPPGLTVHWLCTLFEIVHLFGQKLLNYRSVWGYVSFWNPSAAGIKKCTKFRHPPHHFENISMFLLYVLLLQCFCLRFLNR